MPCLPVLSILYQFHELDYVAIEELKVITVNFIVNFICLFYGQDSLGINNCKTWKKQVSLPKEFNINKWNNHIDCK